MADKLGLGPEIRELKIGTSFTNPKALAFHSLRCKYFLYDVSCCKEFEKYLFEMGAYVFTHFLLRFR